MVSGENERHKPKKKNREALGARIDCHSIWKHVLLRPLVVWSRGYYVIITSTEDASSTLQPLLLKNLTKWQNLRRKTLTWGSSVPQQTLFKFSKMFEKCSNRFNIQLAKIEMLTLYKRDLFFYFFSFLEEKSCQVIHFWASVACDDW